MKVSVSFLKYQNSKEETIKKILATSADYIHVDIMDGIFVNEKNDDLDEFISLLKDVNKPLDIHLMVSNPKEYITKLQILKPLFITIQAEILNPLVYINQIKSYGIKVGLALNPDSKLSLLQNYLKYLDLVLIMSVYPGKGGQQFLKEVIPKIKELKGENVLISVDGGINDETINYVKDDVDICVSGSFICLSDDYEKQIDKLRIGGSYGKS